MIMDDTTLREIRLGGNDAEYLLLTIHRREFPGSTDYWDGNWLVCSVEVVAGSFSGRHSNRCLRNDELSRFFAGLVALDDRLKGEAALETLEEWFSLRLIGDGRGHVQAIGFLRDDFVEANELKFWLSFDQTYLALLIAQCRDVLEAYPIVGQPNATP
jgi:hypothetical protein